jgi:hypothetical protein
MQHNAWLSSGRSSRSAMCWGTWTTPRISGAAPPPPSPESREQASAAAHGTSSLSTRRPHVGPQGQPSRPPLLHPRSSCAPALPSHDPACKHPAAGTHASAAGLGAICYARDVTGGGTRALHFVGRGGGWIEGRLERGCDMSFKDLGTWWCWMKRREESLAFRPVPASQLAHCCLPSGPSLPPTRPVSASHPAHPWPVPASLPAGSPVLGRDVQSSLVDEPEGRARGTHVRGTGSRDCTWARNGELARAMATEEPATFCGYGRSCAPLSPCFHMLGGGMLLACLPHI